MQTFLLSLLLLHLSFSICRCQSTLPRHFQAIFAFGDSIFDSGNNNFISTPSKANHPPYGSAFPGGQATGRFSNGMLVSDFVISRLGNKTLLPPFLDPNLSDDELKTGVNFASGGSGLDELTVQFSQAIATLDQPKLFKKYIAKLKTIVEEQEASKIVDNSLIIISTASNDFLYNFYGIPTRTLQFNISGYQDYLLQKLGNLVQELYHLGGRNFAITGLAPLGCIPLQMTLNFRSLFDRKCVDEQNSDAIAYNSKLEKLLREIQDRLSGSKIAYANTYDAINEIVSHPQKYGFIETTKGCCGTGLFEFGPLCNLHTSTCFDASKYVFWDAVHPTEAAYRVVADLILNKIISKFV